MIFYRIFYLPLPVVRSFFSSFQEWNEQNYNATYLKVSKFYKSVEYCVWDENLFLYYFVLTNEKYLEICVNEI